MQRKPNLLAQSLENPGQEPIGALQSRLCNTNSTWECLTQDRRYPEGITDDTAEIIRATTDDGKRYISTPCTGLVEVLLARRLAKELQAKVCPWPVIPGHGLYPEQELAVRKLLAHNVGCLTGLPGTGKSRTIRALYDSLIKAGLRVLLVAFTGAAASRMGESVGTKRYSTIHRLLGYDGEGFEHTDQNLIECDAIIMDEAGMTDVLLCWCLVRALPAGTRIYFVGDPNQLPAVGEGYLLGDLIEVLPHAELTVIRRTEEGGPIGEAAAQILAGDMPRNAERNGDGFYGLACEDGHEGNKLVNFAARIQHRISIVHQIDFCAVRTMSTTNRWCDAYNSYCSTWYTAGPHPYVATRNKAKIGYYNGDRGYREGDIIHFENGAKDFFSKSDHMLNFAGTVYRMQGREAIGGQLVIANRSPGVPKWQEMYTAVTRAQRRFVVTGNLNFFAKAIRQPHVRTRTTLLRELITGAARVL